MAERMEMDTPTSDAATDKAFAHQDAIKKAKRGTWLMCCAPVEAHRWPEMGGIIVLPEGQRLRVKHPGALIAETAIQDIVIGVIITPESWHTLEFESVD